MSDKIELVIGGGSPDRKGLKPAIGGSSDQIIVNNKWGLCIDVGIYPQSRAARKRQAEKVFSVEQAKPKMEYNVLPGGLVKVAVLRKLQATPDSDYVFPTTPHYSDSLPNLSALNRVENVVFFITHGHADHVGAAAWAKKLFPRAKFLMTEETLEIAKWLWADYLKNMRAENRRRRKEGKLFVRPIFSELDVDRLIQDVIIVRPGEALTVGPFELRPFLAGHILGAVSLFVKTITNPSITIFHTGDISFDDQSPIHGAPRLDYAVLGGRPDYLISEATYGSSDPTTTPEEAEAECAHDVAEHIEGGGKVIMPTLAIGKTQRVFAILKRYGILGRWPGRFHIDGSGRATSSIYKKYSGDPIMSDIEDYFVRDNNYEDRMRGTSERDKILFSDEPAGVIVPAGMVHGGWAVRYASQWAEDERNLIALTCYQDPSLPGWRLLNTPRGSRVKFEHRLVTLNATVKKYDIRGHASRSQILEMIDRLQPRQTFLKHGEAESMDRLIREAGIGTISKTYLGDRYTL